MCYVKFGNFCWQLDDLGVFTVLSFDWIVTWMNENCQFTLVLQLALAKVVWKYCLCVWSLIEEKKKIYTFSKT